VAMALIPPELAGKVAEARTTATQAMERLTQGLESFDVNLAKLTRKSRQKVEYQVSKIEKKVAREILLRNANASAHAGYLYGLIYPHRHLQERLYSILPFLAWHGFELIDTIYDNVQLECPDHQLLVI
jgi:uncharacterized protein YllA (UPF0747 family)